MSICFTNAQCLSPPYYDHNAEFHDLPRQWLRKFRKSRGLPSSCDVEVLAEMLSKLIVPTNSFLGSLGPVDLALVTVPKLPALYMEDLVDACEYVGIRLLILPWYVYRSGDCAQWPVVEVNTAYAGKGFGICNSYKNLTRCGEEIRQMPDQNVFAVLFTRTALTAHVSPIWSAQHMYDAVGIVNFDLGLDNEHTPAYWSRIRSALREAMGNYSRRGEKLGQVVSYGESVENEDFDRILKEEVLNYQVDPAGPRFSVKEPIFAAARGAAEFAKRAPFLCLHADDCFPDLTPKPPGW